MPVGAEREAGAAALMAEPRSRLPAQNAVVCHFEKLVDDRARRARENRTWRAEL